MLRKECGIVKRVITNLLALLVFCFLCMGYVQAEDLEEQYGSRGNEEASNVENNVVADGAGDVSVEDADNNQKRDAAGAGTLLIKKGQTLGKYELNVSTLNFSQAFTSVQFAVWSDVNGQDDLRWYIASNRGNGIYCCNLSLAQHKGSGKYYVHAYVMTAEGLTALAAEEFEVPAPAISNISIDDVNKKTGTFNICAQGIQNSEYIKKIQYAVWSEINGQDDIVWYDAEPNGNNEYEREINIGSHKYSLGEYQIHVYVTDLSGEQLFMGKASQKMELDKGTISIDKGEKDYTYLIELKDVTVPGGAAGVQFPVWSEVNGQDDIRWYNAEKTGETSYQVKVSLKNHKGFGKYNVHAYVITKSGELIGLGGETFSVDGPELGKVSVENYDKEKGTFQILVSDIENVELIQGIQIPTWSEADGQDDIRWYQAKKNDQGQYTVDVNIKNHKYSMGEYISHVYITDITGHFYCAGSAKHHVEMEKGKLTVTQDVSNERQYIIELKDFSIPGGAAAVQFPVWSAPGGQDDIVWYTANKQLDGTYRFRMSVEDHKGLGTFNVHAYAKMPGGILCAIGGTSFDIEAPIIGDMKVSCDKKMKGEFRVEITGVENSELIQKIQVPIWSEKNQGDIVWYTAEKDYKGDYHVDVNINRHKYNIGDYNIHLYLTDITGVLQSANKTAVCDMRAEYTSLKALDTEGTEKTFTITLSDLEVPAGEKGMSFAVWGDSSGQNDLRWYTGKKESDGTFSYTMKIRDHKELGTYKVHAYCTTKANMLCYVGETTFLVEKTPTSVVSISEVDGTKGSFKVTAAGITAPSGVEKVQIPVWHADNQSDIMWYEANKVAEGTYTANVKVANHAHHFGTYMAHVYVTMGNGIMINTGKTDTDITPKDYVYNVRLNSMQREVGVMGASANRVQFPTWSQANGQDDIIWYEGVNCGNGKWNAVVNSLNHQSAGEYVTHVYVTDDSGSRNVGSTTYSLDRLPPDQAAMHARANMYGSTTPYLILVNKSTHKVGVFQGWQGNWNQISYWDCADGKASTPTVEGVFHVGSRGYYFNSGAYRCYWWTQFYGDYLFHSVLYDWNGVLQDGRVGMGLSHGCVRLPIDQAKWIYDTIPTGTTVVVYR